MEIDTERSLAALAMVVAEQHQELKSLRSCSDAVLAEYKELKKKNDTLKVQYDECDRIREEWLRKFEKCSGEKEELQIKLGTLSNEIDELKQVFNAKADECKELARKVKDGKKEMNGQLRIQRERIDGLKAQLNDTDYLVKKLKDKLFKWNPYTGKDIGMSVEEYPIRPCVVVKLEVVKKGVQNVASGIIPVGSVFCAAGAVVIEDGKYVLGNVDEGVEIRSWKVIE